MKVSLFHTKLDKGGKACAITKGPIHLSLFSRKGISETHQNSLSTACDLSGSEKIRRQAVLLWQASLGLWEGLGKQLKVTVKGY